MILFLGSDFICSGTFIKKPLPFVASYKLALEYCPVWSFALPNQFTTCEDVTEYKLNGLVLLDFGQEASNFCPKELLS